VENVGPSHFACNPSIGANAIKWAWSANWGYTKKSMPHHAGEQLFFLFTVTANKLKCKLLKIVAEMAAVGLQKKKAKVWGALNLDREYPKCLSKARPGEKFNN